MRADDPFAFQGPEAELPEPIRRAVEQEERTEAALDRAAGVEPEPPPEGEDAAQASIRRLAEQRRAEDERAARVNRLMHENPEARPDAEPDPLRELARSQRDRRRRRRL
jgi:hypothetical protein